ncbi:hypothetical protein GKZ90_0010320 [Flavobacterium sp. MC2016-06]|uniref:hypothetical protein n=1 Tax=Flavobacterium sp. MC2016-06 TaxID=2676308 RepID=UPI0012BAFC5F|nr:hypothetical protein [Flavobacterium sp. MC2016-06]MBU3858494.1 hypothetical protein [Flavobacterium sp. MC2016-06]
MGYWCTLHLFDDRKFYNEVVPELRGETGNLSNDCLDFLKGYTVGGISHLSDGKRDELVQHTIEKITSIANSLDKTFKIHDELHKIPEYKEQLSFLGKLEGYYEFCKFFEYYVFKTCADFYPHLILGKGGVYRNFEINVKTLSCSIIAELDDWNAFICYDSMGITSWITSEDVELLYLDKNNLLFTDNERAEGFLTLLEVAYNNKLGLIIGVDMREEKLELLPENKLIDTETWSSIDISKLCWKL